MRVRIGGTKKMKKETKGKGKICKNKTNKQTSKQKKKNGDG